MVFINGITSLMSASSQRCLTCQTTYNQSYTLRRVQSNADVYLSSSVQTTAIIVPKIKIENPHYDQHEENTLAATAAYKMRKKC